MSLFESFQEVEEKDAEPEVRCRIYDWRCEKAIMYLDLMIVLSALGMNPDGLNLPSNLPLPISSTIKFYYIMQYLY